MSCLQRSAWGLTIQEMEKAKNFAFHNLKIRSMRKDLDLVARIS